MTTLSAVVTEVAVPQLLVLPDAFWVDVTQDDIEQGAPGFANACPIARAVLRHFGGGSVLIDVGVSGEAWIDRGCYRHTGSQFARAFDSRSAVVEPCRVWFERLPS